MLVDAQRHLRGQPATPTTGDARAPYLDPVTRPPGSWTRPALQQPGQWVTSTCSRPAWSRSSSKLAGDAANHQIRFPVHSAGETEENSTMLNTTAAPLNDLRVRQALAYATDTKSWAKTVDVDPSTLADGPLPALVEVVRPHRLPHLRPGQGQGPGAGGPGPDRTGQVHDPVHAGPHRGPDLPGPPVAVGQGRHAGGHQHRRRVHPSSPTRSPAPTRPPSGASSASRTPTATSPGGTAPTPSPPSP